MIVIGVITSFVLTFLWSCVILKAGAYIIGSKEGTWKNCAILNGIGFLAIGVLLGCGYIANQGPSLLVTLLYFALVIGAIWLLVRVTMNILDISLGSCLMLQVVTWGLVRLVSFLLGKLENVVPGMRMVSRWLPF